MTRAEELAAKHVALVQRLGMKAYARELLSKEVDRLVVEIANTQREIQSLAREQNAGTQEHGSEGTGSGPAV